MLTEVGYLTTMYTERQNLLAGIKLTELARQKMFVARMVGRTMLQGAKSGAKSVTTSHGREKAGKAAAMTTVNSVHYVTDESVGIAMLPPIKNAFSSVMPETYAAGVAVGTETLAVTGLAVALGLVNMRSREKRTAKDRDTSTAASAMTVWGMGLPFASQLGFIRDKKELAKQSAIFGASHLAIAGGILGASEALASTSILYAGAAALITKQAVEAAFDHQAEQLGIAEEATQMYVGRHIAQENEVPELL